MATPISQVEEAEAALNSKDDPLYELLDGELVEQFVSFESSSVAAESIGIIRPFVRPTNMGRQAGADHGIRIFSDPMRTRRADLSFIRAERAPRVDQGYLRVPPDLVGEVVSPGDNAADLRAKVDEWLQNGVRRVWVVYPDAREVHVYRAAGRPSILGADDDISGEDVIPGFSCAVRELFPAR